MGKQRLDKLLTARGMFESRERAKMAIAGGAVYVNGAKADKAGANVDEDALLEIRGETLKYVSRGGLKLEKALSVFGISLDGAVAADFGASTGGFTDCMLQNGAKHVFSIDVGHGQLADKLRADSRVTAMEDTDARAVTAETLGCRMDFVSVDVSFISLALVLPAVRSVLSEDGCAVVLIKPQFEAGRGKVGKNGVVRDRKVHEEVIENFISAANAAGFAVLGIDFSPITGPEGNIEYIALLSKNGKNAQVDVKGVVRASHDALGKER